MKNSETSNNFLSLQLSIQQVWLSSTSWTLTHCSNTHHFSVLSAKKTNTVQWLFWMLKMSMQSQCKTWICLRNNIKLFSIYVTSGQSNMTAGHIAGTHGWFNVIRHVCQCAPPRNTFPWVSTQVQMQMTSRSVQPFLRSSWQIIVKHLRACPPP